MPHEEFTRQPNSSIIERQSILQAWGTAISSTCSYITSAENFVPVSMALIVGCASYKEFNGAFVPYFLVCGISAVIAKIVPSCILPVSASYLVFKTMSKRT